MTTVTRFPPPGDGRAGFEVVAGAPTGLSQLLLVAGRLPADDLGPVHLHYGEEILHVLDGRLLVRIGRQRREVGPGEVISVPAGVWHGFEALAETRLEVVAAQRIGTVYPVRGADGTTDLVEVHRQDMPWGRPPPDGAWTDDAAMRAVLDNLALAVR